jgi:lysyl-tRNA synthetase class 2
LIDYTIDNNILIEKNNMSSEESLIQVRKDKHLEANQGSFPLASKGISIEHLLNQMNLVSPPMSLTRDDLPVNVYTIHGRITNFRKSGSIAFIKVRDESGTVQVISSRAVFSGHDSFLKLLDLGDIVEVKGQMCCSKTGENSLLVTEITLLTKAHRAPPEKWAGIADTEIKYRKRYLDLLSSEESRAVFTVRSLVLRALRVYLDNHGFMEVETSTLNAIASGANAKPFITHHNALDTEMYLRIAPELYLKRLVVGGFEKVYEIARCYRNEGVSTRHNPEFTMLEFYQAYGKFSDLVEYAKDLLAFVDNFLETFLPSNAKSWFLKWKEERSFTLNEFKIVTMLDATINAASKANIIFTYNSNKFDEFDINVVDVTNTRLQKIDIKGLFNSLQDCLSVGEKLMVAFEYLAEPFLAEDYQNDEGKSLPVFITEYPSEVCPLARVKDDNPYVCDRFELFINGRELCNAFQELNNPDEQAEKFSAQLESNQKDAMAYDADYVEALQHGMPPTIGFGMGVDRLVMLLTNAASIKDVILFPTMRGSNV